MLNNRTDVCRTRSVTHDVHCIIGSSNHFLITCLFPCISVLDPQLSSACVKHAGGYDGYLEIAEEYNIIEYNQDPSWTRLDKRPADS